MVAVLFSIVYFLKRNETEGKVEYRLAYGDKGLEMVTRMLGPGFGDHRFFGSSPFLRYNHHFVFSSPFWVEMVTSKKTVIW